MYTLKPDQVFKGHSELFENDLPKLCPYQAPMMVQTPLSQSPVPMFKGCGTWCALFQLHEVRVKINCSSQLQSFSITEDKPSLKLL